MAKMKNWFWGLLPLVLLALLLGVFLTYGAGGGMRGVGVGGGRLI